MTRCIWLQLLCYAALQLHRIALYNCIAMYILHCNYTSHCIVYCIASYIVLHCILHGIALHCILHCIVYCMTLHIALHRILHCIAYCIALYIALHCILHCIVYCIALYIALHCIILHCIYHKSLNLDVSSLNPLLRCLHRIQAFQSHRVWADRSNLSKRRTRRSWWSVTSSAPAKSCVQACLQYVKLACTAFCGFVFLFVVYAYTDVSMHGLLVCYYICYGRVMQTDLKSEFWWSRCIACETASRQYINSSN